MASPARQEHDPRYVTRPVVPAGKDVLTLARDGKAAIVRLALAGHTIAALIVLRSGDTAWCWKIAYDERHARNSPGVQLVLHATRPPSTIAAIKLILLAFIWSLFVWFVLLFSPPTSSAD